MPVVSKVPIARVESVSHRGKFLSSPINWHDAITLGCTPLPRNSRASVAGMSDGVNPLIRQVKEYRGRAQTLVYQQYG